jgi:histidinol-phosphate aminotransferase
VLADIHGAAKRAVPLKEDFALPTVAELRRGRRWDFRAALTYITTPHAPSGRPYGVRELAALCRAQKGVVILDEAYVDFADEDALSLALQFPHVLVARTFSKGYSLCFLRVGYAIGHPDLIAALQKIRDSYNVNGLGQVAAEATLADLSYYRANFRRLKATRQRLGQNLSALGFELLPSQTNFFLVRPPLFSARIWLERWREAKVLVRWWDHPEVRDYLRITIGTDAEADALLRAAKRILAQTSESR